MHIKTHFRV